MCPQTDVRGAVTDTVTGFDFASSELNEASVRQLHRGKFIENVENVVLIGGPRTGKSHVATAIDVQAIEHHRRKVHFYSTVELAIALEQENGPNASQIDLLILDKLDYLPFCQSGGALLFQRLIKLYERSSVITTTNISFREWPKVFGDAKQLHCLNSSLSAAISLKSAMKALALQTAKKQQRKPQRTPPH
tara:strand:- start:422 stop:994 length:573 start_codon:yes stop_codon:yes gene_type:complete